jgi:hypothetical protein
MSGTKSTGNDIAALSQLTNYLHTSHGLTYDTKQGKAEYWGYYSLPTLTNSGTILDYQFNATGYMTKSNGDTVNCYDQAAALTVFGRLLGINVQYTYSSSFGYINTKTLVGGITTNNPFFDAKNIYGNFIYSTNPVVDLTTSGSTAPYRLTYDYDGTLQGNRSAFGNHAYVTIGTDDPGTFNVYDACSGPITNTLLTDYFASTIDFATNIQHNARFSSFCKETASELVSAISIVSINGLT